MIRPLPAPRFTRRARAALATFTESHEGVDPVLRVEAYQGLEGETEIVLQFVEADSPRAPGEVERVDVPVPVRFTPSTGAQLAEHLIDFVDEEGVRGFRVRPAGPSGSRAPGPSSSCSASRPLPGPGPQAEPFAPPTSAPPTSAPLAGGDQATSIRAPEIVAAVERELRNRVNPLVSSHGGQVRLIRLRDGRHGGGPVAEVEMSGGCQGCGAARETLQDIVARILRKGVPELAGVEDVTDHDAGLAPFFPAR
jgi:Fe-S cluster biogenesis protein NfuA